MSQLPLPPAAASFPVSQPELRGFFRVVEAPESSVLSIVDLDEERRFGPDATLRRARLRRYVTWAIGGAVVLCGAAMLVAHT